MESYQSKEVQQKSEDNAMAQSIRRESLAFELSLSKSMQVVEGESKRSISESLNLEFSLSFENSNIMSNKGQVPSPKEASTTLEDMFSPENTAGRIVDFIKSAFKYSRLFGENKLESEDEVKRFQDSQTGAVEDGFKQARGLLGKLPEDIEDGISQTFDLVMKGLDKFFSGDEEVENDAMVELLEPSDGNYYSSQSFSLSYQLEVNAEGNFAPEELQEFMNGRLEQVQDAFQSFLDSITGETDSKDKQTFNPMELFQFGSLNTERIQSLLQE
jgi:hypothetical protein